MDLAAVKKLVSGEGWGLLQSLPPYDESSALALGEGLRVAGFDADLVAAALTQSRLRAKGRAKFGDFAAGMLFTSDGLEQATRLEIAARHAGRFRAAGMRQVFDLGCGIGADAMAIAGLDLKVTAIDADEVTATLAGVNLRHWPAASASVGTVEGTRLPKGEGARHTGAWLDPARRTPGRHGRARPDPARVQPGRHLTLVVHGAVHRAVAAGHRGQAVTIVPSRRDPGRHRGAVDIAGRRGAGVRDLVGSSGEQRRAVSVGDRFGRAVVDRA